MYVYIRCGDILKRFVDVTLKECFKPAVGDIEEKRIEPALWFKVLVLDSVFVNCDNRAVYWSLGTETANIHSICSSQLRPIDAVSFFDDKEKVFEDGECSDFDPYIDELFETAAHVVHGCAGESADNVPVETGRLLLQLLHMFILPTIKFHKQDRQAIANVLGQIEQEQEAIEHVIQLKNKTKQNTENSLRRQREKLMSKCIGEQSSQYIAACDEDFLTFFLQHVEKDIKRTNERLIDLEGKVQSRRNPVDVDSTRVLERLRSDRNSAYEYIEKCITAREAIKNVISRPHIKKNIKRSQHPLNEPFHNVYTEISRSLLKANKEIQVLINSKIQKASVRESVCLALQEIDIDGESYGYHRKIGTDEMDTNIYDRKSRPEEWSTLTDNVSNLLRAKHFGFLMRKVKFCEMIHDKIQRIFDDSKMFSINARTQSNGTLNEPLSPNTAELLSVFGEDCQQHRPMSQRTSTKPPISPSIAVTYNSRWSLGSISRSEVEVVCQEIVEHISQMSIDMAIELKPHADVNGAYLNKLYICYEYHVSECLMPLLNDLFEHIYRDQCDGLVTWLSHISLSDLGFDDSAIAALLGMIQRNKQHEEIHKDKSDMVDRTGETDVKVPYSTVDYSRFQKDTAIAARKHLTLGSMKLKQSTLNMLYSSADEECDSMRDSFEGALAMDNCVEALLPGDTSVSEDRHSSHIASSPAGTSIGKTDAQSSVYEDMSDGMSGCEHRNVLYSSNHDNNLSAIVSVDSGDNAGAEPNTEHVTHVTRTGANFIPTPEQTHNSSLQGPLDQYSVSVDLSQPPAYDDAVRTTDRGSDTTSMNDGVRMRDKYIDAPPKYSTLSPIHAKFTQTFHKAETFIKKENQACTLFRKYKQIKKLLCYIQTELSRVREEGGCKGGICADDLIDASTLIIALLDKDALLKLYAHMNLVIQISPTFMHGNAHEYSLVTLTIAYRYLFDQMVLHRETL